MAASWAFAMLNDLLFGELRYFGMAFDLGQGGVRAWGLDAETIASEGRTVGPIGPLAIDHRFYYDCLKPR